MLFIGAPSYRLAKFLDKWIKSIVRIESEYFSYIKNIKELTKEINSFKIPKSTN